jgi:hypothetical protein
MLAATPLFAMVYIGLGVPWALALLPRRDWRDWPLAICLAFAIGPALLTVWMLLLGITGSADDPRLNPGAITAGAVALALAGGLIALWRRRAPADAPAPAAPLAWDEKLLIALVAGATLIRWLVIAYWPFTAYDALWVYGYQGRLYTLLGYIPSNIGYYPQFLPLQYTFAQLMLGGIDDHAARAALPFLNVGSILAAWVLGARLFNRRVGIIAAALWALYPHMGAWSRFGDLEIPQAFLFTLAAAFFLMAWTGTPRRHYALIAGLVLGVALWTKPTAGALVWGVLLLLALDLARVRLDWRAWWPRLELALITGLACIPLGGVWYARNLLLGHAPVVLPTDYWLTQAARSGAEFGWPLLALLALLALVYLGPSPRTDWRRGLMGLGLVLAALLPTLTRAYTAPADIAAQRMGIIEWLLLAAGAGLLLVTLRPLGQLSEYTRCTVAKTGWALALALPYFITWFYSYSYHYRLSFAIVPLLLLPTAVILGGWFTARRVAGWPGMRRALYGAVIVGLALPGVIIPLYDANAGWDWLWTDALPDDMARYRSGNGALLNVVEGFEIYLQENDAPLVVAAPGVVRLPFFFPLADIRTGDAPTRFAELDGVRYLVYGSPESDGAYGGIPMQRNQVVGGFARSGTTVENIMRRAWGKDDGIFRYQVYELHLERRFNDPQMIHDPAQAVIFGGFARYRGHGIGGDTFWPGRQLIMQLYWQALQPAPHDYMIYLHLRDPAGQVVAAWDGPVASPEFHDGLYYSTLVWEPGEFIIDERRLRLPDDAHPPEGEGYELWFGFYDLQTGARVPVTVDGQPAGDGYRVNERIKIRAAPPGR